MVGPVDDIRLYAEIGLTLEGELCRLETGEHRVPSQVFDPWFQQDIPKIGVSGEAQLPGNTTRDLPFPYAIDHQNAPRRQRDFCGSK